MEGINKKDEKIIFGNKIFPINNIKNQDEYEVEIIIPEKNDEKKSLAQINCKIIFFWSNFMFYDEKRKKLEKKLINLENAINKLKLYLNEINDNIIIENIKQEKESFLKRISLRNNKMLFRFVIILGFLTSFYRSDFPNQIGGILFLFGMFYINVINNNYEKIIYYLKNIYKGVIFLLIYDLIWIILNFKNTILGYNKDEILMKKISLILAFCNVIIKIIICFNLIFEIKEYKNR